MYYRYDQGKGYMQGFKGLYSEEEFIIKKRHVKPKKPKSLVPTESDEQQALFKWAFNHPVLKDYILHIPNERKCSVAAGAKFKRLGVRSGIPDIYLPIPKKSYHGLWIELKRVSGSKVQDSQKDWIAKLKAQGYAVYVAYGWMEAKAILEDYLNGTGFSQKA